MKNKNFVALLEIMFILFIAVFGSAGCGGGHSSLLSGPETIHNRVFTVTFDSSGGSVVANQTVREGEKAVEPTAPTKDGYTFGGWYTDSALTERFSFNTVITANITLYAKWNAPDVITYTVTFNSNGGNSVQSQNVVVGEQAVPPADPTREGYTFKGWHVDQELTEEFVFSTPITKHITLYAKWEENKGVPEPEFGTTKYSVVFDSVGGTEIEEQIVVEEGNAVRPDDPEKDNFVFLGWFDDEGYIYDFEAPVYSNTFLTAGWSALEEVTDKEAELFEEAYIGGEIFTSFDNSPITSVEVQYVLDGIGTVEISEVTDNPMCNTAGLIGSPVEITAIGANVENAEIVFHYDPQKLEVEPDDISVTWYNSFNDKVVLLSNDTVIDTENNVAKILVNHFSMYELVSKKQFLEAWNKIIPVEVDIGIAIIFNAAPYFNHDSYFVSNDRKYYEDQARKALEDFFDSFYLHEDVDYGSLYCATPELGLRDVLERFEEYGGNLGVIILFSEGSPSPFYEYMLPTVLQELQNKNIKVITVSMVDKPNDSVMQNIANATGGSYIKNPSNLCKTFYEIAVSDGKAEKKTDTDRDGLQDALEKDGMRDQYGKIWSTDFTLADTDGDGLSDDVEMGKYITDFSPFYFKRFSNPNKTTKIEDGSSCTLPSKVNTAIKHRGEKMLYLTVNLKSFGYKDFKEYEAFFQPVKKLEFDITDLPEGFELKTKNIDSTEKQRYIGGYIDKDYTLTAAIAYEDENVELNAVNLKLTIDDMTTYNELSIDRTKIYVNSESLKKAKSAAASVTGAFIGELQNEARNVIEANAHDDNAANRLKKQMTAYNIGLTNDGSTPPDEVYTAFARAVLRAIEDCNINDYSYKIDRMGVDLILQVIKQLMGNRTQNYTFNINGLEYNVTFDIHTMSTSGAYTGFGSANISWYDKSLKEHKWLLTWTTSQRENYEALANYCSVLNKLEDSTVKQFFVTYINTAFKLVEVNKKINVEHLEKAELIIRALCGDKEAGKELSMEVLGKLDDKYHELLKNFIKKNIPGGKEFLTIAEKLNKTREKRDDFQNKITEYAALSESEKTASNQFEITEKAYSELKSAYDSLSEIDILEGFFVPSINWPSWF